MRVHIPQGYKSPSGAGLPERLIVRVPYSRSLSHMSGKETEHCGRCAMSSVVGVATESGDEEPGGENPFEGERIEVSDEHLRLTSPGAWLSRLVSRLDEAATQFVYGRR
jgi:hypothetical protein